MRASRQPMRDGHRLSKLRARPVPFPGRCWPDRVRWRESGTRTRDRGRRQDGSPAQRQGSSLRLRAPAPGRGDRQDVRRRHAGRLRPLQAARAMTQAEYGTG